MWPSRRMARAMPIPIQRSGPAGYEATSLTNSPITSRVSAPSAIPAAPELKSIALDANALAGADHRAKMCRKGRIANRIGHRSISARYRRTLLKRLWRTGKTKTCTTDPAIPLKARAYPISSGCGLRRVGLVQIYFL